MAKGKMKTQGQKVCLLNLTTTTKQGGVETFVWELGRELAARGYAVTVVGGRGPIRHDYPGVQVRTHRFISREGWRRLPLLGRQYGLTKLLERLSFAVFALPALLRARYDVIHIQKPYDLPLAAVARWLTRARLLFGCHGRDYWAGDRFFVRFVDGAVSCSRFNAAEIHDHYRLHPQVVYNGFDTQLFSPRPPAAELMARYGPKMILFMGRLIRWKGAQYLIEALALGKEAGDPLADAQVVIAGDGSYRPQLEALARELGVAERVSFVGDIPHSDAPRYMASAAVVVGTSFANETFGMVLCEASACARPLVASDFGGFPEVVRAGESGLLYPPQDAPALAAALRRILSDPAAAATLGAAGQQYVNANFTWAVVTDRVVAAYERVVVEGRQGLATVTISATLRQCAGENFALVAQ